MKFPPFSYHRPTSVPEAVALLAEHGADAKVLAGGQSLLPVMALRLGQPDHLVDIGRIESLCHIEVTASGLRIGAGVTHAEAEDSSTVATHAPLLASALPWIGHRAIRNRGTVCGSIAHADPAAELPAVALAADATLVAVSVRGERRIPASGFFEGFLTTVLAADELLVAVEFPAMSPGTHSKVYELARRHGDYAMVGLAASLRIDGMGVVEAAALSYFAVGSTPVRVRVAEDALVGQPITAAAIASTASTVRTELDPPSDNHASANYRRHIAGVITERVLTSITSSENAHTGYGAIA